GSVLLPSRKRPASRDAGYRSDASRPRGGHVMTTTLDAVRAAALFAGDLQPSQHPGPPLVRRTVAAVLHRHGADWCTARVAEEFDRQPAAAAHRLAWALRVVRDCYA